MGVSVVAMVSRQSETLFSPSKFSAFVWVAVYVSDTGALTSQVISPWVSVVAMVSRQSETLFSPSKFSAFVWVAVYVSDTGALTSRVISPWVSVVAMGDVSRQ